VKRYHFRLATVLRVRRVQEDLATQRLADANRGVQKADAHRGRRVEAYRTLAPAPAGMSADDVRFDRLIRLSAATSIAEATRALADAQGVVEVRRQEWTEAAQEVDALERLDERHHELHDHEVRRDEDKTVDDTTSARHRRAEDQP
jgi:flagellar FliJ protein